MNIIKLSDKQLQDLVALLKRVTMTGDEAIVYADLMNTFAKAEKEGVSDAS